MIKGNGTRFSNLKLSWQMWSCAVEKNYVALKKKHISVNMAVHVKMWYYRYESFWLPPATVKKNQAACEVCQIINRAEHWAASNMLRGEFLHIL